MGAAEAIISDDDKKLLVAHYGFYQDLDTGQRAPTTPAQQHFVAVCRGTASPETEHERAYARFRQAIAAADVDEAAVVVARFVPSSTATGDDDQDFGQVVDVPVRPCAACGRPIPPERLAAIPAATRCVSCQQRTEAAPSDWRVSELVCPRCASHGLQSRMVWRTAYDPAISGYFLGCSRFPECRYVDRT